MAEDLRQQLETMRALLKSHDWVVWLNFLKKDRRLHLQNKVNSAVKEGDVVQAQIALALMDDCLKQIELFGRIISETESKINQGAK